MSPGHAEKPPEGCVAACPGCRHRGWPQKASLAQKYNWLSRALIPWATALQPVASGDESERWFYRDRAQLASEWSPITRTWQFGLRRRDELIAIHHCPVQSKRIQALIELLSNALPEPDQGFHMAYLVQSGAQTTLVLKQAEPPPLYWFDAKFKDALYQIGIEGFWLHRHPSAGKKVLAKNHWDLLAGQPRSLDDKGLWYGPAAFQQLLPNLFHQALDEATEHLRPSSNSAIIDLYCGTGSSLTRWTERNASVLGIEIGGEALACAAINAPLAELLRGSCLHRLPQLENWHKRQGNKERLLYTNPPRTGMESAVCEWVTQRLRPTRIAYLSCSAGTLAKDLRVLEEAGYRVMRLSPYDFFPQTHHVETLALLSRP